ncbi:MAG: cob(I)yrinic acid a,c-diamide adenosyltransferase [Fimbriimonadaceae bacterium]|nr:cob(I)yrinic acid a,c-diamide adenosyltransferase [Fimbriimonadaceae bacterium]
MSIATQRGDGGTTQLFHGPRVSKADPRVEAYGCLDELGAHLGLARALAGDDPLATRLEAVQRELFVVGAELACPPAERGRLKTRLTPAQVAGLGAQVAELEALPGMLSDWALPGATVLGSQLDVARTVCRRTERRVVALFDQGAEDHRELLRYLNRLADLLWLYARWFELRQEAGGALRPGRRGFGPA